MSLKETGRLSEVAKERHGSGSVDHIAFAADDYDELIASFDRHGLKYRATQVPGSDLYELGRRVTGRVAITNYDPRTMTDAARAELNALASNNPGSFVLVEGV